MTTFFYRPEDATGPLAGAEGVQAECKGNKHLADICGAVHEGTLENVKNELDTICQRVDDVDRKIDNELHQLEQQMQKLIENLDWKATTRKGVAPKGVKPYSVTFRRGASSRSRSLSSIAASAW